MRRHSTFVRSALLAGIACAAVFPCVAAAMPRAAAPAQVVDRIVARIEDDIITLSQVRQLAGFQQLLDGHSESDDKVLNELIEQWVVNNEASAAGFPQPADSEVDREAARIADRFPDAAAYDRRLAALGLTPDTVRRFVARQIYLARYLDYKFRPSVQVDDGAIANYYKGQLVPELAAQGKPAPPLNTVSDQIREVLVQQGINERAESWFEETRSRLQIEIDLDGQPGGGTP